MIAMIAAMDRHRVIGRDNCLPWRLPADQAYFKQTTLGHTVVMGRKTYESIGKPLVGRTNVVLTRDEDYQAPGCRVVHAVEEVLAMEAEAGEDGELFIIGGAEIYRRFMDHADRLYVTLVEAEVEGDAFFPEIEENVWEVREETRREADGENRYGCGFLIYERRK